MSQVYISTVTPVYNGSDYLRDTVGQLAQVRNAWKEQFPGLVLLESIFVVDDCVDDSDKVLSVLAKEHNWVKVITLSRNFGQHPATVAGILHTSGDWVVTLDEDLQHDPKDIFQFLIKLAKEEKDVCYGKSTASVHRSILRDTLASGFKKCISFITQNKDVPNFSSFRTIRGDIGRAAAAISRSETYFDIALGWFTQRVTTVELEMIDKRNQGKGRSGYSILGLFRHGKRMLMTSKIKLLRIGIIIGLITFLISLILTLFAFHSWYFNTVTRDVRGWLSIFTALLFFGGLIALLCGIILESMSDIQDGIQGKPTFFKVDRSKDAILLKILCIEKQHEVL